MTHQWASLCLNNSEHLAYAVIAHKLLAPSYRSSPGRYPPKGSCSSSSYPSRPHSKTQSSQRSWKSAWTSVTACLRVPSHRTFYSEFKRAQNTALSEVLALKLGAPGLSGWKLYNFGAVWDAMQYCYHQTILGSSERQCCNCSTRYRDTDISEYLYTHKFAICRIWVSWRHKNLKTLWNAWSDRDQTWSVYDVAHLTPPFNSHGAPV